MNIRCIALDLDRTTLNAQGRLSAANRNALETAIAAGIHVVIASGRAFDTLPKEVLAVEGIEYAITCNGAAMYHVPSGKCLKKYQLSKEAVETVMRVSAGENVMYEAFIDGIAYAGRAYIEDPMRFGASPQAVRYVRETRHMQDDIVAFIHEHKEHLDSMDIIVNGEDKKRELWERIAQAAEEVYITSSIAPLIEISHHDAGKGSGLAFIIDLLGIKREETAAFGDADNDMDMLRFAGCGIAVANASDNCKAAADYITKRFDEDGVAYGMREILQIC
ncbi:MAG: Cof-type HAD-IIB family hydrolase [Ruminococcus sp.]|nr:Cof-type HAD-IIB family hydrolase [Ruminococcus sp.]